MSVPLRGIVYYFSSFFCFLIVEIILCEFPDWIRGVGRQLSLGLNVGFLHIYSLSGNVWRNQAETAKDLYVSSQFWWEIWKFHCLMKELGQFIFSNPWTLLKKAYNNSSCLNLARWRGRIAICSKNNWHCQLL